jgi:formate-dependent nitrite reductase membrane component NrfD
MDGVTLQVSGWPWYYVAVYFFLGGIAAGSYLLAAIADVFGDSEEDAPLIKTGHYLALALVIICPILLVADLGRPERFWRMMTQFKWDSPVSLGSWGLFLFGLFCALSAAIWLAKDGYFEKGPLKALNPIGQELHRLPRRLIARIGAFFGIFVAGYTGVLLSSTTNPFWNSNQFLGITFLASALSTAIAIVSILLIWQGHSKLISLHNFRNLWLIVLGFEVFLVAWEIFHEEGAILLTGQFLFTFVIAVAVIGVLIPLALLAWNVGRPMSTGLLMAIAIMVLVGGFFLRYSVLVAGQESIGGAEHALRLLGFG